MSKLGFGLLLFVLAGACASPTESDLSDVMIGDRELPPVPDGAFQIVTPVVEVPPGEEMFWCWYGEYDGPPVGVYKMVVHDDPRYSHHSLLKEPIENDHPTGSLVDCSSLMEQIPPRPTLLESVGVIDDDGAEHDDHGDHEEHENIDDWLEGYRWVDLPSEIGFEFQTGQKYLADIHFVNTSPETIRTRVVFDLYTTPAEEMDAFVGTFNHDAGGFAVPANGELTVNFDCAFEEDATLLSMGGHMHNHGSHYQVDILDDSGQLVSPGVYEVDPWTPDMQYEPVIYNFEPGEFTVRGGEQFRTWCSWENRTNRDLSFPDEMCTTFGVAYPAPDSLYCIGEQNPPAQPPPTGN